MISIRELNIKDLLDFPQVQSLCGVYRSIIVTQSSDAGARDVLKPHPYMQVATSPTEMQSLISLHKVVHTHFMLHLAFKSYRAIISLFESTIVLYASLIIMLYSYIGQFF